MDEQPDPRAMFYLRNRDDIETWAALRSDAQDVLARQLLGCVGAVQAFAAERGADVYSRNLDGGPYPRVGLTRPEWRHAGQVDVAVVLGWDLARLLVPGEEDEWPYVSVRMSYKQKDQDRRRHVAAMLQPLQGRQYFSSRLGNAWPLWQPVELEGESLVDPAAMAELCLGAYERLWELVAPVLDGSPR